METVIAALISGIACLACGFALGVVYRKKVGEAEIGSAEIQARKILEDGIRSAENKKKELCSKPRMKLSKQRTTLSWN